jgi:uncharacterized protein with HEPN domain
MQKDEAYLLEMLLAAREVCDFVVGVDRVSFHADKMRHYAVVQRLTVIGEAASKLSATCRAAHPEIPWKAMVGMRNILVHAYGSVNLDVVWDTATHGMDELIASLEAIVPPDPGGEPM